MDILFWLAIFSGLFMAWAVGANDVANAMGTSVGSKVITIKQAILIAAVFEGLGALLASGVVTGTIRNDIVDVSYYQSEIIILALGMIASLLASATWLMLATQKGWPVSTTHSIVGAVLGFGLVSQGYEYVQWGKISIIALSWVTTPIVSALIGSIVFKIIQNFVLMNAHPLVRSKVFFVITTSIFSWFVMKALVVAYQVEWLLIPMSALIIVCAIAALMYLQVNAEATLIKHYREQYEGAEKIFGMLALSTACAMAFAHGANDVANAIGPLASVIEILEYGTLQQSNALPFWVTALGSIGVVLGLAMFGYKIIASVGTKITTLSPSRSFSAQLATALVVLGASWLGFPVSTTHTLVGAVLGVGLARGFAAVNLSVVRGIFMSWAVTIPAGAVFSIGYFLLLKELV